ncbi:MAG TPA: hypothetical protein VF941_01135 [Clostridia bacterium]
MENFFSEQFEQKVDVKEQTTNTLIKTKLPENRQLLETTSDPLYKIPVFLSYARPYNNLQQVFLDRIISNIQRGLLFPRTLGRSDQYTIEPLPSIRRMMLSSFGLLAVAFRRVFVTNAVSRPGTVQEQTFTDFWLTSPYLQIEPSMAFQVGLPIMLMVEDGVSTNNVFGGVLEQGAGPFNIIRFSINDLDSIENFFNNNVFWKETFEDWVGQVRCYYQRKTEPN